MPSHIIGKVWLQTLILPNLAHALQPCLTSEPQPTTTTTGEAGVVLQNLFSR